MLRCAFACIANYPSSPQSSRFATDTGWVQTLTKQENQELVDELIPLVAQLPLVITVGTGNGQFHIVHAELMSGAPHVSGASLRHIASGTIKAKNHILTDEDLTEERLSNMKEALLRARRVIRILKPERATALDTSAGRTLISRTP